MIGRCNRFGERSIRGVGNVFNQPISRVVWPKTLEKLSWGWKFNQLLVGARFPPKVKVLVLAYFNQTIEVVKSPVGLEYLDFGKEFNQPIERVEWPDGLKSIQFDDHFNQPVEKVAWPIGLE